MHPFYVESDLSAGSTVLAHWSQYGSPLVGTALRILYALFDFRPPSAFLKLTTGGRTAASRSAARPSDATSTTASQDRKSPSSRLVPFANTVLLTDPSALSRLPTHHTRLASQQTLLLLLLLLLLLHSRTNDVTRARIRVQLYTHARTHTHTHTHTRTHTLKSQRAAGDHDIDGVLRRAELD
jgi:C4-dicarboxylate-specific signal transduction histidine kinase